MDKQFILPEYGIRLWANLGTTDAHGFTQINPEEEDFEGINLCKSVLICGFKLTYNFLKYAAY